MKLLQRIKHFLFGPPRDTTFDDYIPAAKKIEAGSYPEGIDHTPYIEEKRKNIRQYVEETNESDIRLNIDLTYPGRYDPIGHIPLGKQKLLHALASETELTHEQIEAASHGDSATQD